MAKIIAIANQKGGVAKTTTTWAFAAGLKNKGLKVLVIDFDPQGNLSSSVGAETINSPTAYDLIRCDAEADEVIQHFDIFDIIPANIMLAGADQELSQTGKEHRLKERMEGVKDNYDFIIIDTPPSLGILTINAFTFADEVIIPTTANVFAANGIQQLSTTIKNVQKYCNPHVAIVGILLVRYNPRANISKDLKDLTEKLSQYINAKMFDTYIRNAVVIEEAQARKESIFIISPASTVAVDYNQFIEEYLGKKQSGIS